MFDIVCIIYRVMEDDGIFVFWFRVEKVFVVFVKDFVDVVCINVDVKVWNVNGWVRGVRIVIVYFIDEKEIVDQQCVFY